MLTSWRQPQILSLPERVVSARVPSRVSGLPAPQRVGRGQERAQELVTTERGMTLPRICEWSELYFAFHRGH